MCIRDRDNTTKDGFWVGKFNVDGATLWNYRYGVLGGYTVNVAKRSHIDIFGDLNVAINKYQNTDGELTVDVVKLGYNGIIKSHTNNKFDVNNIEGLTAHTYSLTVLVIFMYMVKLLGIEMSYYYHLQVVKLQILQVITLQHS
mgnify:CR=1 FL=1